VHLNEQSSGCYENIHANSNFMQLSNTTTKQLNEFVPENIKKFKGLLLSKNLFAQIKQLFLGEFFFFCVDGARAALP
jgi:hypothetical protein